MSSILCSEHFKKFYDSIEHIGLSLEQLADLISSEIHVIADDIFLGSMSIEFVSPPMPYNQSGTNGAKELYISPCGCESSAVSTEFRTGDNGSVTLTSFPRKGHIWSKEEEDEITFLHKSIFVIFGRTRLTDIIRSSLSSDALTKLPNSTGFISIGNRLFNENRLHEYTAMYINLKNFRCINSQISDKHGTDVIKAYAETVHAMLRKDEVLARLGGDNFTLLVKDERAEKIVAHLSEMTVEVELDSTKMTFVIAARIGMYDIHKGDSMPHVMNCISIAINGVRRNPAINVMRFTPEIMQKIEREHTLTAMFAGAVKNREFIVYYQPKVTLSNSRMCGCEALVRWKRDGKIISPAEFIPVFERDGNICALDFYMLDNVCRDISEWIKQGLEPVTVSVNFSKTHLHDPHIAEEIMAIINKYGIDTKYIEVEMTEMSDFNDYDAFKQLVTKMKENGVVTSIDDFGTGYSSLNLLTDFMFDVVKLDKSFLDNISRSHSRTDEIVVRNIVKMIKELGMKVIAEGVETVEQAQFLKDIDCTMVQGYLFDKPLCCEEFVARLAEKNYEKLL